MGGAIEESQKGNASLLILFPLMFVVMLTLLGLALGRRVTAGNRTGVELVSWYWHFVDCVWIVVFAVVYLIGR